VLFSTLATSKTYPAFFQHLNQVVPTYFAKTDLGKHNSHLQQKTLQVWHEIQSQQASESQNSTDAIIFAHFQAKIEQEMIAHFLKPTSKANSDNGVQSIWIIHTPTIATPLVTMGELSPTLAATNQDQARIKIALERAHILRDYLANGGTVVTVYAQDNKTGKNGRTPEQLDIFEKLKQEFPLNVVECPIAADKLPGKQFPAHLVGATYLVQGQDGEIFMMTNRGAQLNTAKTATWGLWLSAQSENNVNVAQKFQEVSQFLNEVGLHDALMQHAKQHGIATEKYLAPLKLLSPKG
jgi:hypothetical protein